MPLEQRDQLEPGYAGDYKTRRSDSLIDPDYLFNATRATDGLMSSEDKVKVDDEPTARMAGDDTQFAIVTSAKDIQDSIDETRTQPYILLVRSATATVVHDGATYRHGQMLFLAPSPNTTIEAGPVVVEPNGLNPRILRTSDASTVRGQLVLQRNRDRPLWIICEGEFAVVVDASGFNAHDGDILYVAPFDDNARLIANTRDQGGTAGLFPKNIATIADINGDYSMPIWNINRDYLIARGVKQYEVWVKSRAVHVVDNWTPVHDHIVDFNINTQEQTTIGLTSADKIVPVQWVPRLPDGTAEASMIVTTFLTIGDGGGAGLTPDEKAKLDAIKSFSDIQPEPPGITGGDFPSRLTFRIGQRIENTAFTQARVQVQGQPIHTEAGDVTGGGIIIAELSAEEITRIANGIEATDETARVDLYLDHAGGTELWRWDYPVHNEDFAAGGGGEGGVDSTARAAARAAQTAADAAQSTADTAQTAANGAKTAADKAQSDATAAGTLAAAADGKTDTNAAAIKVNADDIAALEGHSSLARKQLLGREAAASDFRGSYTRWRGAVADRTAMFALPSPADGDVCYRIDEDNFHSYLSGGWSPIAGNNTPAAWEYYATFADAVAGETATNRLVIWATGSLFSTYVGLPTTLHAVEVADEAAYTELTVKPDNILFWWEA